MTNEEWMKAVEGNLETALCDAQLQAAARKVEADDLRRQRDELRADDEKSRGVGV